MVARPCLSDHLIVQTSQGSFSRLLCQDFEIEQDGLHLFGPRLFCGFLDEEQFTQQMDVAQRMRATIAFIRCPAIMDARAPGRPGKIPLASNAAVPRC